MTLIRTAVSVLVLALLAIGYFSSLTAYFEGREAAIEYARRVDRAEVAWPALGFSVIAAAMMFFGQGRTQGESA
jgi:hypothetical protein